MNQDKDHRVEPGSFRDRYSRVFYSHGRVYRGLSEKALSNWQKLSNTGFFSRFIAEGKIVQTELVNPLDEGIPKNLVQDWATVLRHDLIPFISYPYEWSFSMLKDAALLHLEILLAAIDEDMILKDSSPYNIQWFGTKPVFIDIPSIERFSDGEPWVGYRQFCQLFLYPLLLQSYKDVAFHPWLRGRIDGMDPDQIINLMSLWDLLRPGVFTNVYMLSKMEHLYGDSKTNFKVMLRNLGFRKDIVKANVKRIRHLVRRLEWKHTKSQWSNYIYSHTYSDLEHHRKEKFIKEITEFRRWHLAWDIGCNIGLFSKIVSKNSDYVNAMDADHLTVDQLYQSLKKEKTNNILPLVMNIADASPDIGWRGMERKALAHRGKPNLMLCLALIHHIVIGANIPLREFVEWLASLKSSLVIEFINKDDPMVKKLLRNKDDQYFDYDVRNFENYLRDNYFIRRIESLESGTRKLYFADPN